MLNPNQIQNNMRSGRRPGIWRRAVSLLAAAALAFCCAGTTGWKGVTVRAAGETASTTARDPFNNAYRARTANHPTEKTAPTQASQIQPDEDAPESVTTGGDLKEDGSPNISAEAAIVMDCDTGMVLYALNENKQMPMASTTKIMTCILALESGDIGRYITVTEDCMDLLDGTKLGLKVGDTITMHDLCVGMMMLSGNDAANTAAVAVGGSIGNFVSMMNQKAAELGMLNTHFDTPSGLDQFSDGAHYSTAYDMALLGRYAMQNPDFRNIVGFRSRSVYFGEYSKRGYVLYTHNYLMEGQRYGYEGCDGIKTGVTVLAGQCLVSHVSSGEGLHLVCVTLNNLNRWHDHRVLYNYAKSLYGTMETDGDISGFDATVVGGSKKTVQAECHPDATFNLLKSQQATVKKQLVYPPFIYAPIEAGDVLGYLQYEADGVVVAKYPITATESVSSNTNGWFTDYVKALRDRTTAAAKKKKTRK